MRLPDRAATPAVGAVVISALTSHAAFELTQPIEGKAPVTRARQPR